LKNFAPKLNLNHNIDSVVAQFVEYQTTMQEVTGSNPQWTDTQGLKITDGDLVVIVMSIIFVLNNAL